MKKTKKKTILVLAVVLLLTLGSAYGGIVYYDTNGEDYGSLPSSEERFYLPDPGCATHTHGLPPAKRCYSFQYSQVDSDGEEPGSEKLTAADRRCVNQCTAQTVEVGCTTGSGSSYQYSASTSWNVGATWEIVKDIFSVGAGYSESNTESWTQNEFTSKTVPVTCYSPKCKKTGHWPKFDLDISTFSGPVKYHCFCWYILNQEWLYEGFHADGTGTATHKTRTLMTTSIPDPEDEENDCPTDTPCHCGHSTCVCKQ